MRWWAMKDLGAFVRALPVRSLLLAMLVITPPLAAAPSAVVDWQDATDGLPANAVDALARDRYGYVWIGTRGGLVRHQAGDLTVLRPDPDDPRSLPGDNVLALSAAADGSVWAAISGQGLVRLRGTTVDAHWPNESAGGDLRGRYIWALAEACDGAMWGAYADDGLVRIDPGDDRPVHFTPAEAGVPDSGFSVELAVDRHCRIWLLRTDGLWRKRSDEPVFDRIVAVGDETLSIFLAMGVEGERAWIGGDEGLIEVDLSAQGAERVVGAWPMDRIVSVVQPAGDGRLWLGFRRGAASFDPATGRATQIGSREHRLGSVQVADLLPGPGDALWIATSGGVARLAPGWRGFQVLDTSSPGGEASVTSLAEHKGRLWVGLADGELRRIDLADAPNASPQARFQFSDGAVIGIVADDEQTLALQSVGVFAFDRAAGRFFIEPQTRARGAASPSMIAAAGQGQVWLGDERGRLQLLDRDGETLSVWTADPDGAGAQEAPALRMIKQGPDGRWWLLDESTLYRRDGKGRFVAQLEAESGGFAAFALDDRHVWVASDALLQRFRITEQGLRQTDRFTAGDGLPAGRIRELLPDRDRLWILTSVGLARLNVATGRFRLLSQRRAIAPIHFSAARPILLGDGRLALGTGRGVLLVDPDRILPAAVPPPTYITRVRAGERLVPLSPDDAGRLTLGWRENSLELSYRALSYSNPAQTRYRVRLLGWDEAWRTSIGRTSAYYGNLPPGTYTFEVQAAGVDGVWNRSGDRLTLSVSPPPWRTAPAWAAYVLVGTALGGFGWRSMAARRRREQELRRLEERRRLAEHQRSVLTRLNRSLEASSLARAIGEAVLDVTGASGCHVGYLHSDFPQRVWSFGDCDRLRTREPFDAALSGAGAGQVLRLAESEPALAAVWVPDPDSAEHADEARLSLFVSAAGQVLENARLLGEVRELAIQARAASDAKSEFLAAMSHEIRTPLHGLLGMMESLGAGERDPERARTVRTMRDSGRQLQRILDDVLDLSRIEAGRPDLAERPFELPLLLERVIELHAPNASASGLALRLRCNADLPVMAVGDPDRLGQVIGNLLSNAIKFTDRGAVELAARLTRDRTLVLAVVDTGPGIPLERQGELFQPFTQLEPIATRRHGGTGLGLAISRRLVDAMGGVLSLHSVPDRGSCFELRLPLPGLAPQRPFHSALLDGLTVGAALPGTEARVLLRICRRWGLAFRRMTRDDGPLPDVLIYRDPRLGNEDRARLAARGVACLHLGVSERNAPCLAAPLTEARLIGALFDLRMAAQTAG